jgi:hypothetical protein
MHDLIRVHELPCGRADSRKHPGNDHSVPSRRRGRVIKHADEGRDNRCPGNRPEPHARNRGVRQQGGLGRRGDKRARHDQSHDP